MQILWKISSKAVRSVNRVYLRKVSFYAVDGRSRLGCSGVPLKTDFRGKVIFILNM